jgi:hypothetical protein
MVDIPSGNEAVLLFEQIRCKLDSSAAVTERRALQPNSKLIIL